MWISTKAFTELIHDRSQAQGVAQALERHNAVLQTTMDWMTFRLTQLEHERAQLIFQYMGVKITVPTIESAQPPMTAETILNQSISFEDVGDEEAARLGVGWNELGEFTPKVK